MAKAKFFIACAAAAVMAVPAAAESKPKVRDLIGQNQNLVDAFGNDLTGHALAKMALTLNICAQDGATPEVDFERYKRAYDVAQELMSGGQEASDRQLLVFLQFPPPEHIKKCPTSWVNAATGLPQYQYWNVSEWQYWSAHGGSLSEVHAALDAQKKRAALGVEKKRAALGAEKNKPKTVYSTYTYFETDREERACARKANALKEELDYVNVLINDFYDSSGKLKGDLTEGQIESVKHLEKRKDKLFKDYKKAQKDLEEFRASGKKCGDEQAALAPASAEDKKPYAPKPGDFRPPQGELTPWGWIEFRTGKSRSEGFGEINAGTIVAAGGEHAAVLAQIDKWTSFEGSVGAITPLEIDKKPVTAYASYNYMKTDDVEDASSVPEGGPDSTALTYADAFNFPSGMGSSTGLSLGTGFGLDSSAQASGKIHELNVGAMVHFWNDWMSLINPGFGFMHREITTDFQAQATATLGGSALSDLSQANAYHTETDQFGAYLSLYAQTQPFVELGDNFKVSAFADGELELYHNNMLGGFTQQNLCGLCGPDEQSVSFSSDFDETSFEIGGGVRAGLKIQLHKYIALKPAYEYRSVGGVLSYELAPSPLEQPSAWVSQSAETHGWSISVTVNLFEPIFQE